MENNNFADIKEQILQDSVFLNRLKGQILPQ
jgi:hypothetical protein